MTRKGHLRLRVLGTARLATGLAAASHFDRCFGGLKKVKLMLLRRERTRRANAVADERIEVG